MSIFRWHFIVVDSDGAKFVEMLGYETARSDQPSKRAFVVAIQELAVFRAAKTFFKM